MGERVGVCSARSGGEGWCVLCEEWGRGLVCALRGVGERVGVCSARSEGRELVCAL